jgi:tRNA A-37 threonylcarbamoyl transferase component Bud32
LGSQRKKSGIDPDVQPAAFSIQSRSPECRPGYPPWIPVVVGASRPDYTDCRPGDTLRVEIPGQLIKAEPRTLIWRGRLADGETGVFKLYRHRSWTDYARERATRFRVQREFETLRRIEAAGIRCSPPCLWGYGTQGRSERVELLVTRNIPGAINLKQFLSRNRDIGSQFDASGLFVEIRRMHRSGIFHGALFPKNVLVTDSEVPPEFFVIDFPSAIQFPADLFGTGMARYDLATLLRALVGHFGFTACEELLQVYGMSGVEPGNLIRQLVRQRPTRRARKRRTALFRVRSWVAWLAGLPKWIP